MLNLNYNTTFTSLNSQPRAIANYNYSASIWVIGGGGGGASVNGTTNPDIPGGGGGAGAAVSASVAIIPNLSYTIVVGQSGSRDTDGSDSSLLGWDGVDSQALGIFAQGGKKGLLRIGGNAGSGSVVRTTTQLFPANVGASGSGASSGGGASAINPGELSPPNGGAGITSPLIGIIPGDYAAAGGGGGGSQFQVNGAPNGGGFMQNGQSGSFVYPYYGSGGGGAGAEPAGGGDSLGGPGAIGVAVIRYSGKQKAFGGTIFYNTGSNETTHYYTSSGQFLYTYPYPWEDVPSGSFPQ
jgi:hypothetical protein